MNAKTIIRIVLLAVIAIAVGGWAMKEFGPARTAATDGDGKTTAVATRPDGVTVINFHGEKRCRTCIGIGNQARRTLDEEFAAEEKAGKVRWEHINYDEPANAHFVKDYELVSSTVVATLWKDGKEVKWSRLDGVWDHVDDEPTFRAYVAQGVRDLLKLP
jgi:hypothetical protein